MCENKNDTMADAEKGEFVWDDLDVTGKIDMDKYDIQYISVKELISSIDDKDISVDFSIGLINIYKNNIAFITDLYFNKKKYSDIKMDRDKTIIFNPQNVKLFPENYRLQTVKNIYLVCFMKGEKIKNEKTGNEQHTINYNYPVRILRSFSKKSCDIIQVHDDYVGIIALKEALENSEKMQNAELLENSYKELEETKIKEIESELL